MKKAVITGITGQDGSYLSELLRGKGYEVHGLTRGMSRHTDGVSEYLHHGQLLNQGRLRFDEVYNLASQSSVALSFEDPMQSAADAFRVACLLEDIRHRPNRPKFYQASSSDMFGCAVGSPQNERTPFRPRSPYACAKAYAHFQAINYREAHGMFVCNGILYNHESPRRGEAYVTRKITRAAARIKLGLQDKLLLGDIDARRDWGFAGDYVEAMWLMLQQDQPDDYVIATGETHSVREFLAEAFGLLDLNWENFVEYDQSQIRPAEVGLLCGDASKAKAKLGWAPKVKFKELVAMMVEHDLDLAKRGL